MPNAYHYQHTFDDDLARDFAEIVKPPALSSKIANLLLWLDADDARTIRTQNGGLVEWKDRSESQNHAVPIAAVDSPIMGTTQNGRNTIHFNANMGLALTQPITPADGATYFIVVNSNGLNNQGIVLSNSNSANNFVWIKNGETQDIIHRAAFDSASLQVNDTVNLRRGDYFQLASAHTNSEDYARIVTNQVWGAINAAARINPITFDRIGYWHTNTAFNLHGNIAEIIIFGRLLAEPEQALVSDYLSRKWNLTAL